MKKSIWRKCICGFLPSGGMEWEKECPVHGNLRKKKSKSKVRYSGVCQCEIYEHCSKCDPDGWEGDLINQL
jgi:hypothetical protein